MKHRLAYLCSSKSWGGLEMNHLRNARWMEERGHDVVILCVNDSPMERQATEWGLSIIHIDYHKKYYDRKNALRLKTLILSESITHLIIRSTRDMSITANVKSKLGAKICTSYFMEMQLGVKKTNWLHTLRFKGIDIWSCPLLWLKSQVETMTRFKNKLVVIPSGLEINQFRNTPDRITCREIIDISKDSYYFGLIGRIDPQKGQLLVVEAMHLCQEIDFKVVFLGEPTIGEGSDYQKELLEKINEYNLSERISFKPFRQDTSVFYGAIDHLIMATKAETFGMVTIESFATGTPVLGSNRGGTVELLQDPKCGSLFESMSPADLAAKMDLIVDRSALVNKEYIQQYASKFDHNLVCESVEEVLGIG